MNKMPPDGWVSIPGDQPDNVQRFPVGTNAHDNAKEVFYRYEATGDSRWHWVVSEHVSVSRKALTDLMTAADELRQALKD